MSSRFVTAGTGEAVDIEENDAWAQARAQVAARAKPQIVSQEVGLQADGKSLYEHLQDQKAAKQEAFEEASKLRHQFRPLNDGEIDFLERVRQEERQKVDDEKRAVEAQMEGFRKGRTQAVEGIEGPDMSSESVERGESEQVKWTSAKKRRRVDEEAKVPVKVKKVDSIPRPLNSSEDEKLGLVSSKPIVTATPTPDTNASTTEENTEVEVATTKSLVAYDSDSDA